VQQAGHLAPEATLGFGELHDDGGPVFSEVRQHE